MGQLQLLKPSESRGLPGSPFPMGHGQGGHLQLSLPLLVPHPCVQKPPFPTSRVPAPRATQPPSCSQGLGDPPSSPVSFLKGDGG